MALERVPADIRIEGGVARMVSPPGFSYFTPLLPFSYPEEVSYFSPHAVIHSFVWARLTLRGEMFLHSNLPYSHPCSSVYSYILLPY